MAERAEARSERWRRLRAELAGRIALLMGRGESFHSAIEGFSMYRHTEPTGAVPATFEASVAVVVQGRKRVELGPHGFVYDASRYLLTSLGLPVVSRVLEASEEEPYLCMVLRLEMGVVRELVSREEARVEEPAAAAASLAMATGTTTVEMLDAFRRLVELLDAPAEIAFFEGMIRREITYRVLQGQAGGRLRALASTGDQSQRTARAVAWIRSNYAKPLRVDDLAATAGMGVSTFHRHFQALTAMSPLQYQKRLRLQAARALLLGEGYDVAGAAFEVGYESASQFTREYSRLYGQPPMRDIRGLLGERNRQEPAAH